MSQWKPADLGDVVAAGTYRYVIDLAVSPPGQPRYESGDIGTVTFTESLTGEDACRGIAASLIADEPQGTECTVTRLELQAVA